MTINAAINGTTVNITLEGRLDTSTSPQLDDAVRQYIDAAGQIVMDFTGLAYCSSAGLRVLIATHKAMMKKGGELIITGANDTVRQVFEVTGLTSVLNIR